MKIIGDNFKSNKEEMEFGKSFKFPPKLKFIMLEFEIGKLNYENIQNIFFEM